MRHENLGEMVRGWFVGDFTPTLCKTGAMEVGIQRYRAGERSDLHYHKIATEITVIVSGEAEMNGVRYKQDDIIVIAPLEATDFHALTDVVTAVVKIPGATNDKYLGRPAESDIVSASADRETENAVHA